MKAQFNTNTIDHQFLSSLVAPTGLPKHVALCSSPVDAASALVSRENNGALIPAELRTNPFDSPTLLSYFTTNRITLVGKQSEIESTIEELISNLPATSEVSQALLQLKDDLSSLCSALATISDFEPNFCLTAAPFRGESWHTDIGLSVGFVTYHGPGTEFIENTDALPSRGRYHVKANAFLHQANTNDFLYLRGDIQGVNTSQGLVHRAPPGGNRSDRVVLYAYVFTDSERVFLGSDS